MWLRDAARRGNSCRRSTSSTIPKYFPVPLGPGVLGVRRRPLGRRRRRRDAGDRRGAPATIEVAIERVLGVDAEAAVGRVARRDPATPTEPMLDAATAAVGGRAASCIKGEGGSAATSTSARRSAPTARWIAFLSERSLLLDRSVRRRRGDRQGPAQADEHRHRSALLEPSVHLLGRRVGRRPASASRSPRSPTGRPALAIFDAQSGRQGARDPARRTSTRSSTRRGRPTARAIAFTGHEPRAHRPVRARSRASDSCAS